MKKQRREKTKKAPQAGGASRLTRTCPISSRTTKRSRQPFRPLWREATC